MELPCLVLSFSSKPFNGLSAPPATVYKGMSTFDYIKMQRQRGSKSQDAGAGNPREAAAGSGVPQVRLFSFFSLSHVHTVLHLKVVFFSL